MTIKYEEIFNSIFKKKGALKENLLKSFVIKSKQSSDTISELDPTINEINDDLITTHYSQQVKNSSGLDDSINTSKNQFSRQEDIEKNEEKGDKEHKEIKEEDEEIEIKLKYEWLIKFYSIIKFFFRYEYNLFTIWIHEVVPMTKTNILSLFITRLWLSLSVVTYLSPENSQGDSDTSSSVYNKL